MNLFYNHIEIIVYFLRCSYRSAERPKVLTFCLLFSFLAGKLETGTGVATFCEKALLALEVLIHPRDIPLVSYPIPVAAPISMNEVDDDEMYAGWWGASDDEIQPPGDENGDKQPQLMEVDAQKSYGVEQERREDNREAAALSIEPEKIESSSVLPPGLDSSHSQVSVDLLPYPDLQNSGSDTKDAVSQAADEDRLSKKSYHDLPGNSSLKGKELMNDSESESLDSVPHIVDVDPETDSD